MTVGATSQPDLYQLLGVHRRATTKEIKRAYRKKALDTHPDKNKNVSPEEAAEAFRKVVEAFEVLSDETSRRRYDRYGTTSNSGENNNSSGGSRNQQRQQQYRSSFQWNWGSRSRRLKDKFEVKQAQSRVLHVVSLSQLMTIMLDDNDVLDRNLLVCITTPLSAQHADDEMVFPYPFAHMSSQGIWWEDLLQTVRIQFYRSSELSRFFNVTAAEANEAPVILFAARGTALTEETAPHLPRLSTRDRIAMEEWVWQQIEVTLVFQNDHNHPVEVYWIHGSRAQKKLTLKPGERRTHTSMLSHEWYFRDERVDSFDTSPGRYKLTEASSLGSVKILSDNPVQDILIPRRKCFDLSGHCSFWRMEGACRNNAGFMDHYCKLTCGHCTSDEERKRDEF